MIERTPANENAPGQGGILSTANSTLGAVSYPGAKSVKGRVLADLLDERRITHLDCWLEHGSSRLAHHILRLRQAGWPIETREVDVPTRDGRVARIAEYLLPPSAIAEAGEQGREHVAAVRTARVA